MNLMRNLAIRLFAVALATALPLTAAAVFLNHDGMGQALIFPYYTVQSSGGDAFNTYISVMNPRRERKALRVRVREGRNGAEVASFNVFISHGDTWTGAIVPTAEGAALVTSDSTCLDGPMLRPGGPGTPGTIFFSGLAYQFDGGGETLARTREGFIEILEMGVLQGASDDAAIMLSGGAPRNCPAILGVANLETSAPTGGLSGTITLINVANGMDFGMNAEALADLADRAYFRLPADSYPGFNANEIVRTSVVTANGYVYRSDWASGADAVSAVLMRTRAWGDIVLDAATLSRTDVVNTFPTWPYYVTSLAAMAPFDQKFAWPAVCSATAGMSALVSIEPPYISVFDRIGAQRNLHPPDFGVQPPQTPHCSSASEVLDMLPGAPGQIVDPLRSPVLGSFNRKFAAGPWASDRFENGAILIEYVISDFHSLTSLPSSTRLESSTGAIRTGSHAFFGSPVVGFTARTFSNGTLRCGAGSCQGNYGGAFPLRYERRITP